MKATGIVRRIDELGRVVIPKEIRRTQRIRRGDPLEIFTTGDGEVIFKKYSPIGELQGVAVQYAEVLSKSFGLTAFVADRDRILAAAGTRRRAAGAALRGLAPGAAVRLAHRGGRGCDGGRGPADGGPGRPPQRRPAKGRGRGGGLFGKADGRVRTHYYNREAPAGWRGPFCCL